MIEVNSLKRQISTKSFRCSCSNSRPLTKNLRRTVIQLSKAIKTCSRSQPCLSKVLWMNNKAKHKTINDKSTSCAKVFRRPKTRLYRPSQMLKKLKKALRGKSLDLCKLNKLTNCRSRSSKLISL